MPVQESFTDMAFPTKGIDLSGAYSMQRAGTTPSGVNVRSFEPSSNRARGGNRSGLVKQLATRPSGAANVLSELMPLVTIVSPPPGGTMESSASGRVVTLVAVSAGYVAIANAGDTAWTATTNSSSGTPPLITTGVVRSAPNNGKLYFADGANFRYYDPKTNAVSDWAATAGTLPGQNLLPKDYPRLICTWRGRTVLSGLRKDPQNWFMSAVSDPYNWDYAPTSPSPAQAVAGNNSPLGLIGDMVTALIPWSDDTLICGGDHTIYRFSGDPANGGQIDLVSDSIGIAWGIPWCKGPDLTLYFFSNRTGIYSMAPGQPPQRISQAIDPLLQDVDTGLYTIRMLWDDRFQGLHVFITKTSAAAVATHFFFETRTGAWWEDQFGNNNFNPLCCCVFDGNSPNDRVSLIGSWDGYVRAIDPTAEDDDGVPIDSEVVIGPILTRDMDMMLLKDLQAVLATTSGDVDYSVYVAASAEQAVLDMEHDEAILAGTARGPLKSCSSGTWTKGRNLSNLVRRAGHAVYIKLRSSNAWALEQIRARVAGKGKVQRRGR